MRPGQNAGADPRADRRLPLRSLARAAIGLSGLLLVYGLWPRSEDGGDGGGGVATVALAPESTTLGADSKPSIDRQAPAALVSSGAHWPVSLAGSVPDGELEQDASGRLRPSRGLRRLFDYFLTAQGERSLPAIRQLLADYLGEHYPPALVAEAMSGFDEYLAYQSALASLPPETDLIARLDALVALRRHWFDADTAEAFFGAEERSTRSTLERRAIASDPDIDAGERQARLDALAASVPVWQAVLDAEAGTAVVVAEQTEWLDARQADAATRHAERAARFGTAAADRLAGLDQQRADWDARIAAYVQARDAIRADPGLSPAQINAAIAALRASRFDPNEQRRIASLEAIGQL